MAARNGCGTKVKCQVPEQYADTACDITPHNNWGWTTSAAKLVKPTTQIDYSALAELAT
jgi:hypothetical protein